MTGRPTSVLSRTLYGRFLFSVVGTERDDAPNSGESITVLTALSRIGVDPWREAARLAVMPRVDAAASLAATFVNLPDTRWAAGDAASAAQRIIDTLPQLSRHGPPALSLRIFLTWQFWAATGLVLALVALNHMENGT